LRLNKKVSSKFFFGGFWGFAVIVILYILQVFRYTKITNRVYITYVCVSYTYIYIYVCVSWRTWYKRLWGGYHIYIYIYTRITNNTYSNRILKWMNSICYYIIRTYSKY
jgi:hypothetical protein